MNPFDLPGPPFLLFYVIFSVTVIVAMRVMNRALEATRRGGPTPLIDDPYALAMLRGGQPEALRVATVSLIDRGLLKAQTDNKICSTARAAVYARRPIEKAIVDTFKHSKRALDVLKSTHALTAPCDAYKKELRDMGALTSPATVAGRIVPFALALFLVEGTAVLKIAIALSRGRHNIGFLIILAVIALIALLAALAKPRTGYGDLLLRQHRERFERLKDRADSLRPGGTTNEVAILAALWGLSVLPKTTFPYAKDLFPKAASSTSDSWGGGCGGGSSDGGGGGCGGGGCGGGCGGCGG